MSEWNGLASLDLTDVDASAGGGRLPPGQYAVVCKDVRVESIGQTQNKKLTVDLDDVDGTGDIRVNFNVVHQSQMAQDICRRQLKSFLIAANHPDPNKPGDVEKIKGLTCKVIVGMGKEWTDRNGDKRQHSEVKKYLPIDADPAPKADTFDDDIPF